MAVVAGTQDAEDEYITLSLASSATFELGGSTLSAEGKAAIADLVSQFKDREVNSVIIEGHTDDRDMQRSTRTCLRSVLKR